MLPASVGNLTKLGVITLDGNEMKDPPPEVMMLAQRNAADLVKYLDKIRMAEYTHTLNLNGYMLRSIPYSVSLLTNLTQLSLSENRIAELPPFIATLTDLSMLHLSSNQLDSLPGEIARLQKLEDFRIDNNMFEEVPRALMELYALKKVSLSYSKLQALLFLSLSVSLSPSLSLTNTHTHRCPSPTTSCRRCRRTCAGLRTSRTLTPTTTTC